MLHGFLKHSLYFMGAKEQNLVYGWHASIPVDLVLDDRVPKVGGAKLAIDLNCVNY
jgi:hypothetical protein